MHAHTMQHDHGNAGPGIVVPWHALDSRLSRNLNQLIMQLSQQITNIHFL